MAKQAGPFPLERTIGDLTFYKYAGQYYVRRKSSLTAKRIKKDPAYALFRHHSDLFALASSIAKPLYWMLPKAKRQHRVYGALTGKIKQLLMEEKALFEIVCWFLK